MVIVKWRVAKAFKTPTVMKSFSGQNFKGGPLEAQQTVMDEGSFSKIVTSNRIEICKQGGCHDISTTSGYCRFHYLASWRKSKTKEAKKKGVELDAYLSDLARKFPEEFLEKLRTEVDEALDKERATESSDADEPEKSLFEPADGDEDLDTIIKGLKVEDF